MSNLGKNEDWFEVEVLTEQNQWNEYILTGLRTSWGISLDKLTTFSFFDAQLKLKLNRMIENELAQIQSNHFILTKKGLLQADALAADLFM